MLPVASLSNFARSLLCASLGVLITVDHPAERCWPTCWFWAPQVLDILKETGYSEDRFFIHCDGALFGMMVRCRAEGGLRGA